MCMALAVCAILGTLFLGALILWRTRSIAEMSSRLETLGLKVAATGALVTRRGNQIRNDIDAIRRRVLTLESRVNDVSSDKLSKREYRSDIDEVLQMLAVRQRAIEIYELSGEQQLMTVRALLELSMRTEYPLVRLECIKPLGDMARKNEVAMKRLSDMAKSDPSMVVRLAADEALDHENASE